MQIKERLSIDEMQLIGRGWDESNLEFELELII